MKCWIISFHSFWLIDSNAGLSVLRRKYHIREAWGFHAALSVAESDLQLSFLTFPAFLPSLIDYKQFTIRFLWKHHIKN
jgi:hypothetical protein